MCSDPNIIRSATEPFWAGAAEGRLMLQRCCETGTVFYYPRATSPFTGGPTEWLEASGKGEIYSCSVSTRTLPGYCLAYVRLEEGPLLLTKVEADDLQSIAIGQRVAVAFRPDASGRAVPVFRLQEK